MGGGYKKEKKLSPYCFKLVYIVAPENYLLYVKQICFNCVPPLILKIIKCCFQNFFCFGFTFKIELGQDFWSSCTFKWPYLDKSSPKTVVKPLRLKLWNSKFYWLLPYKKISQGLRTLLQNTISHIFSFQHHSWIDFKCLSSLYYLST